MKSNKSGPPDLPPRLSSFEMRLEERSKAGKPAFRTQSCPECGSLMGDMPGSRDAYCPQCGFKDPCCGD